MIKTFRDREARDRERDRGGGEGGDKRERGGDSEFKHRDLYT